MKKYLFYSTPTFRSDKKSKIIEGSYVELEKC